MQFFRGFRGPARAALACLFLIPAACADAGGKGPGADHGALGREIQSVAGVTSGLRGEHRVVLMGDIEYGDAQSAEFTSQARYQAWRFEAAAGDRVDISLDGQARWDDPLLYLFGPRDPEGRYPAQPAASNDDCSGDTWNACIDDLALPAGGHYVIVATTYRAVGVGGYHLMLSCAGGSCDTRLCGSRGLALCGEGEYCHREDTGCGHDDRPGVCKPRPEACIELYQPVCGCDGVTYDNSCFAAFHDVAVSEHQACASPEPDPEPESEPEPQPRPRHAEGEMCGGIAGFQCEAGLQCIIEASYPDAAGICERPGTWYERAWDAQSAHPYANDTDQDWRFSVPGAKRLSVHFEKIDLETDYDFLEIYDGDDTLVARLTGAPALRPIDIEGESVRLRLVTDYSITADGFRVRTVFYQR